MFVLQQHKKVLDKYGKPDDALPGVKNSKEQLPHFPLTGMYNKAGGKVRLTFKLELDQLWLGTKGILFSMSHVCAISFVVVLYTFNISCIKLY